MIYADRYSNFLSEDLVTESKEGVVNHQVNQEKYLFLAEGLSIFAIVPVCILLVDSDKFVPPLKAFVTTSFSFSFRSVGGIFVYIVEKSHTLIFLAAFLLLIFSIFCSIIWLFSTIQFLSIPYKI